MALKIFHQPERFSDTSDPQSPATPADRARAVMDKRIGSVVVQSYNWRRISLGLLVVCIALSIGLTVQSLKSRVIPYVVTVDKSTGEVEKAGAFVSQDYTPQEAEVRYFLAQFIQNARSIQLDPVQQEKMQKNEHFSDRYATYTEQVKIVSIEKIPETDSYHAVWTEEEFEISTGHQESKKYQAVFSITTIPPEDDATLLINPLGIYISDLNFSTELGTTTNGKPSASMVQKQDATQK